MKFLNLLWVGLSLGWATMALPAKAAPARRIVVISGEYEYSSMLTLGNLVEQLRQQPDLKVTFLKRTAGESIPGLAALKDADLVITFIRRMTLPPEQLSIIKDYLSAGHPLVALRTSCHAFQNWPTFDHEVLGGNYHDHWQITFHAVDRIEPAARGNPLVEGVPVEFRSPGTLYKLAPLAPGTQLLCSATLAEDASVNEPVVWTNRYHGGRIFFASLGDPGDFAAEPFMRLLGNGIAWALGDEPLAARLALRPVTSFPPHPLTAEEFAQFRGFSVYDFVDIRPAAEFAQGHLKRAVNLDPSLPGWDDRLAAFSKSRFYAVYGDSAEQAARVARRLHEAGLPVVHYLDAAYAAK